MKNYIQKLIYSFIFILLPLCSALADEEFPDDTDDLTPPAPIDDYVLVVLVAAIAVTFWFFKNQQKKHNISNS